MTEEHCHHHHHRSYFPLNCQKVIKKIKDDATALTARVEALENVDPPTPTPPSGDLPTFFVQEQWPLGTEGGASSAGVESSRKLNTIVINTIDGAYMTGDNTYLPPGKYEVHVRAPAINVGRHRLVLRDMSRGVVIAVGAGAHALNQQTDATLQCFLESTEQIQFYTFHYTETPGYFGLPINHNEVEIYAEMLIKKLS